TGQIAGPPGATASWYSWKIRLRCGDRRPVGGGSKYLEIFAVLPVGHLGQEAVDLGILDVGVIIDELGTELFAEERIVLQRADRIAQRLRQETRLGFVG